MKKSISASSSSLSNTKNRFLTRGSFQRILIGLIGMIVALAGISLIIDPILFPQYFGSVTSPVLFIIGECIIAIAIPHKASSLPKSVAPPEKMEYNDLIDLFKHWDTRVAHQENLFIPATFVPLAAALISWDKLTKPAAVVAAIVSLFIYIYYLLMVRRIANFQDHLFPMIEHLKTGFHNKIIDGPKSWIGVRTMRVLGLLFLAAIWSLLLYELFSSSASPIKQSECWFIMIPVMIAVLSFIRLWKDTPNI